jgi:hypothetical protein
VETPRKIIPRKVNNRDVGLSHTSREIASTDGAENPTFPPSQAPKNTGEMRRADGLPVGRPFAKGWAGGPGRPAGIREYIRQRTQDGRAIVEFLLKVMDDTLYPKRRVRPQDRLEAARLLAERGFGRVPLADGEDRGPEVIILRLKPDPNSPTGYQDY